MRPKITNFLFVSIIALFLFGVTNAQGQKMTGQKMGQTMMGQTMGQKLGYSLISEDQGSILQKNSKELFAPASVLKLLTSIAVLKSYPPSYQFKTDILYDYIENGKINKLIIKGGGDPLFTTESLFEIFSLVKASGIQDINQIYLDDTLFSEKIASSGTNPYQAGLSPLSINFNTAEINQFLKTTNFRDLRKKRTIAGKELEIVSEFNDSILRAPDFSDNLLRVNLATIDVRENFIYNLRYVLSTFDIKFSKITYVDSPINLSEYEVFYTHKSEELIYILRLMNQYSSNFIANQLGFLLGCEGERCSYEKGLDKLRGIFLEILGEGNQSNFIIRDFSGLSAENRVSPWMIASMLSKSLKDPLIEPYLRSTLCIFGVSGTLKKRKIRDISGEESVNILAKTGSINGVVTISGFIRSKQGKRLSFSIFHNEISDPALAEREAEDLIKQFYLLN